MAVQRSPQCNQTISICALRATVLNADGSVADGPNNSYVTNQIMQVQWTPQIEQGQERVRTNGCGCMIGRKKYRDQLKGIDLALDLAQVEPLLFGVLTNAAAILDNSTLPVAVGFSWPVNFGMCNQNEIQPPVAIEFWQENWQGSHQNTVFPYTRHILPKTFWSFGQGTAQDDFTTWSLTASSEGNPNWHDVYHDWAHLSNTPDELGGIFSDLSIPNAFCEALTVGSS